jgi:hypothetical protein
MATFPSLVPSTRRYSMGLFPSTSEPTLGNDPIVFAHGADRYGIRLRLTYDILSQADAQLLRSHYRGQQGSTDPFLLPSVIWSGHSSPSNIAPTSTLWVWDSEPPEGHRSGLLFDVAVDLLSLE